MKFFSTCVSVALLGGTDARLKGSVQQSLEARTVTSIGDMKITLDNVLAQRNIDNMGGGGGSGSGSSNPEDVQDVRDQLSELHKLLPPIIETIRAAHRAAHDAASNYADEVITECQGPFEEAHEGFRAEFEGLEAPILKGIKDYMDEFVSPGGSRATLEQAAEDLRSAVEEKSAACCLASQSCPPDTLVGGSTPCESYTINETIAHIDCNFKDAKETPETCTAALSAEYDRIKADLTTKEGAYVDSAKSCTLGIADEEAKAFEFAMTRGNFMAIATGLIGDKTLAIAALNRILEVEGAAWGNYDTCFNNRQDDFTRAIGAVSGTLKEQNVHDDWSDVHFIQCALELLATDQHAQIHECLGKEVPEIDTGDHVPVFSKKLVRDDTAGDCSSGIERLQTATPDLSTLRIATIVNSLTDAAAFEGEECIAGGVTVSSDTHHNWELPTTWQEYASEMDTSVSEMDTGVTPPQSSEMPWDNGDDIVNPTPEAMPKTLCPISTYCPNGNLSTLIPPDLPAHAWVAMDGGDPNSWVHLGNGGHTMCKDHEPQHGKPAWGTASNPYNPGIALCCAENGGDSPTKISMPRGTSWNMMEEACANAYLK